MHFKPFQAILDHVFFNFFGWLHPRKIQKSLKNIFHTFGLVGEGEYPSVEFSTLFF